MSLGKRVERPPFLQRGLGMMKKDIGQHKVGTRLNLLLQDGQLANYIAIELDNLCP